MEKRSRIRDKAYHRSKNGLRTHHPLYNVWSGMVARCLNEKHTAYKYYGGRGITVCQEWIDSFDKFAKDVGPRPGSGFTLERKDSSKGYEPSNCKWATMEEQGANKRSNRMIVINGETKHLAAWLRQYGVLKGTYSIRRRLGWSEFDAITTPPSRSNKYKKIKSMMPSP